MPYGVDADPNLSAWKNQRQYNARSIYCFWMNSTPRPVSARVDLHSFALANSSVFKCAVILLAIPCEEMEFCLTKLFVQDQLQHDTFLLSNI